MKTIFKTTSALALAFTVISTSNAQAYFSTIDNGELVAPGAYQISLEPQLVLTNNEGFNVVGRLDTGLDQQSSVRAVLGFGKVDFQIGGFYKIVPFPDTATQPAIGADIGALIARVGGETETNIRFHPLASKRFEAEIGDFTPYASLPLGVTWRTGGETTVPVQLVGGTEFRSLNHPNISYFGELGVNINRSFSYLSAAIAYRFDDSMMSGRRNRATN
jgi:hypothetical protein